MKAFKVWVCVAAIAAGGMLTWQASAEETPAKPVVKKESRGPLPAQFGKLGITDEVKDELYKIDDEYDAKIEVLAAQIKVLQAERDTKMQGKLTLAQVTRLKELRDESTAKRTAAAKLKAEAEATKKPSTTTEKKPASAKPVTEKKPE